MGDSAQLGQIIHCSVTNKCGKKKVPLIVSYGQGIVKSDQTTALSIRRDVTTYAGKSFAVTIQETTHCHLPTA